MQSHDAMVADGDASARDEIFARVRSAIGVDFREFKPSDDGAAPFAALGTARRGRPAILLEAARRRAGRDPRVVRGHADPRDLVLPRSGGVRGAERARFPGDHQAQSRRLHVARVGRGLLDRRRGLLDRDRFAGVLWARLAASHPIQIFGSDVSEVAIQKARAGTYSESAMRDVSDERRKRYFNNVDGGFRIHKSVRDLCVFVRHDLVRDPPFSKLDLVSCRNVLIYFDQALQKKVLPMLHYCLNQPGFLLLGRSENISGFNQLFSVADKANKIFMRSATQSSLRFAPRAEIDCQPVDRKALDSAGAFRHSALCSKHLDRLLFALYCPPGVLVKENMDVVLFRGQTGAYLQAAPGQPQNNLIGMARGGLISALRETIAQSKAEMVVVSRRGVEVDQDGSTKTCDVVVVPFSGFPDSKEPLFVVLFEEPGRGAVQAAARVQVADAEPATPAEQRRIARLEHELAATKEYMHTLIEEHGRASDELGTSNEELISGNEELQSMNEELETAKEELQSINEELTTLNDELQRRNQEVTQANSDLLNFSLTVDIPIVRLDMERRIRRFTAKARSILNVLATDVGRPIDDIKLNIDVPDLSAADRRGDRDDDGDRRPRCRTTAVAGIGCRFGRTRPRIT